MLEDTVLNFLTQKLNIKALMEEPEKPELKQYLVVEKTSSTIENYLCCSTIAVKSYAESKYEACKLSDRVVEAMMDIIELDEISKCKLNTNYDFTNTATKRQRYQAVFDLVHYWR